MKTIILLLVLAAATALVPLPAAAAPPYEAAYGTECAKASAFYAEHRAAFERHAATAGLDAAFLFGIVAPELTQYHHLSDRLECYSLKVLYVQGGRSYADFSVGFFQMKPSFVEQMEDSLRLRTALHERFGACLLAAPGSRAARVERIRRLSQLEWQLHYLSLFCALVEARFGDRPFASGEERLRFHAAAYNAGFHRSFEAITAIAGQSLFPHFSTVKYRYADISVWFYSSVTPSVNNNLTN
jgi:hypothetical protein